MPQDVARGTGNRAFAVTQQRATVIYPLVYVASERFFQRNVKVNGKSLAFLSPTIVPRSIVCVHHYEEQLGEPKSKQYICDIIGGQPKEKARRNQKFTGVSGVSGNILSISSPIYCLFRPNGDEIPNLGTIHPIIWGRNSQTGGKSKTKASHRQVP